jgi:hypothetical protein
MQNFIDWVFCFVICVPAGFSVGMGLSYLSGRFPESWTLAPEMAFYCGVWGGVGSWCTAALCCLVHLTFWLAAPIALLTPWVVISALFFAFCVIPQIIPWLVSINERCHALGSDHKAMREDGLE